MTTATSSSTPRPRGHLGLRALTRQSIRRPPDLRIPGRRDPVQQRRWGLVPFPQLLPPLAPGGGDATAARLAADRRRRPVLNPNGAWYTCTTPGGTSITIWLNDPPPALPSPGQLAQEALERMDLQPIQIGIVPEPGPGKLGLVGMPAWMWVDNPTGNTFGPITESATAGPVTVTATAGSTASIGTWATDPCRCTAPAPGPHMRTATASRTHQIAGPVHQDQPGSAQQRIHRHGDRELGRELERRWAVRNDRTQPREQHTDPSR